MGQVNRMDESLKPDWIRRRMSETSLSDAKSEAAKQRKIATMLKTKSEGPEFWRQLYLEVGINVNALPDVGARGRISSFGNPEGREQRYRIDVAQQGSIPGMTYTDLFYTPGDAAIRSRTLENEVVTFDFCVLPDGKIAVVPDDEFVPVSAKKMAEMLVERAVNRV